jgi:16S rRNA U516 pseudouridylate synthase RsuA-like enzyme
LRLVRVAIGRLEAADLPPGKWEKLDHGAIARIWQR